MSNRRRHILIVAPALALVLWGCSGGSRNVRPEALARAEGLLQRAIRAEEKKEIAEAEQLLQAALKVSRSIEESDLTAQILINSARLNRLHRRLPQARRAIDDAMQGLPGHGGLFAEAATEQALVSLAEGNVTAARTWAEQAIGAETGSERGRRLNLLARILLQSGEAARAASVLTEALSENRKHENAAEEANSLRLLGIAARQGQRLGEAERLLNEALAIDKKRGLSGKIALDLEELAATSRQGTELAKAVGYLERACEVNIGGGRPEQAIRNLVELTELYQRMGQPAAAERAARRGDDLRSSPTAQSSSASSETTSPSSRP